MPRQIALAHRPGIYNRDPEGPSVLSQEHPPKVVLSMVIRSCWVFQWSIYLPNDDPRPSWAILPGGARAALSQGTAAAIGSGGMLLLLFSYCWQDWEALIIGSSRSFSAMVRASFGSSSAIPSADRFLGERTPVSSRFQNVWDRLSFQLVNGSFPC